MKKLALTLSVLILSVLGTCLADIKADAKNTQADDRTEYMNQIVKEYKKLNSSNKSSTVLKRRRPPVPVPTPGSCLKTACSKLSKYDCDDDNELSRMARACSGNFGDACLKNSFKYLRRYEVRDLEDMIRLARSCTWVMDLECVNFTCERLRARECDELEEIRKINMQCASDLGRRNF